MSSETAPESDVRSRLIGVAAAVLGEEGPSALTTRRLAREAGTSTMAVYTHFGSLPELVRQVVAHGFEQLRTRTDAVARTDDALHDLAMIAVAYRQHALSDPHLYTVMFGASSLGGFRLTPDERDVGLPAYDVLVAGVARAMASGQLAPGDPAAVAGQLWAPLHGFVMLELSGFDRVVADPEGQILTPLMTNLVSALSAAHPPA